jgi:hypothetical protein
MSDWMQTYTGRMFWPLSPQVEHVHIEDIAHALSMICRFGGHCREFYSVAQHSVLVSHHVEQYAAHLALEGLLHDAAEAYVGDMVRPLKRSMQSYINAEDRVFAAIAKRFGLGGVVHDSVKISDERLLATEARDIMGGESAGKWRLFATPLPDRIIPIPPKEAEKLFLARFNEVVA